MPPGAIRCLSEGISDLHLWNPSVNVVCDAGRGAMFRHGVSVWGWADRLA